jgi:3-oxoadipate enol-lactonase
MDITINGLKINYNTYGPATKTPVVFIHGFPFSQAMWTPQIQALQGNYRLITFDNRGHGKSDAGDGQYPLEFFVDDLIGLLDALKIEQAILCGLSMGGYIALRAVERNPERVNALILCDTRSEADSNEAKIKRAANIRTVKEKGVPVFAEGFLKAVFAAKSFETKTQAVAFIRQVIESNPPLGICGTLLAMASRTDTTVSLPKINVPTLILVGDQDPVTPPAASQAMQKAIPGSELHVIPQAAHLSNLENTEVFNSHLLAFLKRIAA